MSNVKEKQQLQQNITSNMNEFTEEQKIDLNLFFKNCVLPKDEVILKDKLLETVDYRRDLMKKDINLFIEISPFYFISAKLVRFYSQI